MRNIRAGNKTLFVVAVIVMALVFAGAALIGVFYVLSVRSEYLGKTRDALFDKTNAAAAFIDSRDMTVVDGIPSDDDLKTDSELKDRLNSLVQVNKHARFAFILSEREDQVVVIYTSDGIGTTECSNTGTFIPRIRQGYFDVVSLRKAMMIGPEGEGACLTTLSPIIDSETGRVVDVLGINYPESIYYEEANKHIFHAILMAASVLVVLLCLYWFVIQNRRLRKITRESQNRENLFRTIFEQTPIGIGMMSNFNILSAVNKTYLNIFGRTEEELRRISWADLTHPSDLDEDMRFFDQLRNGEITDYSMEKRFIRPDGSIIWVYMIVIRFVLEGLNEQTHLCILQDISTRKTAELAFRESERSKSVLLSHLPGMAYRCLNDAEWTMEFASEGCRALTGYAPEELVGNQIISFNDLISPGYREVLRKEWDRVLARREPFKAEYEMISRDGSHKWVLEFGQGILGEYGEIEALEGIIIDMTERKEQGEHIKYLNDHDFLTGLHNRRYFELEKDRLDTKDNMPLTYIVCDINGVRLINDAFGQIHGDRVIIETSRFLREFCGENDVLARTGGNEFSILMPNTTAGKAADILLRMNHALEQVNKVPRDPGFDLSLAFGYGTKNHTEESLPDVIKEATGSMYSRKLLTQSSSHSSILSAVVATVYERSEETEAHALRLSDISKKIALKLGLPQSEIDEIEVFAMLHDIGKVGIDDRILNKPGRLTEEEWTIMKKHPEIGYRIAKASPELEVVAEYILAHHERWDGKGYPKGLAGEDIPLPSRIIAIADTYDAMTEDRVYRKALSEEEAVREIIANSGKQFDPQIVTLFLEVYSDRKL